MNKVLKNTIADIKHSLKRVMTNEMVQEQGDSVVLLEKALELIQQAEDKAIGKPGYIQPLSVKKSPKEITKSSASDADYSFQLS